MMTYERKPPGSTACETETFKRQVRKIFSKTERGKKLLHLLEENPRPSRMKGLP